MPTNTNCPVAAVRPTPIIATSLRCAPTSGKTVWQIAKDRARIRANCPISGIIRITLRSTGRHGFDYVFLVLGQRLSDLRGHVFFIMLGQDLVGLEYVVATHAAMSHDTLAFPEQVRQDS